MDNHIRFIRKKTYWISQEMLASSVGISREALRLIENGTSDPRVSVALAIADFLCVSVESIFSKDRTRLLEEVNSPGWNGRMWDKNKAIEDAKWKQVFSK